MKIKSAFKATKKPVEIEAILWTGENFPDIEEFTESTSGICKQRGLVITTLEGDMVASVGDYIIKGVQGEFYPCKPDIFKATYNYRCKCGEDISFESVGCIYCKN